MEEKIVLIDHHDEPDKIYVREARAMDHFLRGSRAAPMDHFLRGRRAAPMDHFLRGRRAMDHLLRGRRSYEDDLGEPEEPYDY